MGDENDGTAVLRQGAQNLGSAGRIEVVSGFVEQEHVGTGNHQAGQCQPRLFTTGEHARGLLDGVTLEQERPEHRPGTCVIQFRCRTTHGGQHGGGRIEGLVLLRVVAHDGTMPQVHVPGVGSINTGQDPQQRGLARAIEPEDHHLAAAVDRQIDVGEHLQRTVGARESLGRQRHLAAGARIGEPQSGDLVGAPYFGTLGEDPVRALEHRLGGLGLGRLGAHAFSLIAQGGRLLFGIASFAPAASFIGLTGGEVRRPAHGINIDLLPVGIQVPHLVDRVRQQIGVVADDDEPTLVRGQEFAQPSDGVRIEVVRRFVKQQHVSTTEEDPGELHTSALAAGQRAQWLGKYPFGQSHARRDGRCLGFDRITAQRLELRLRAGVASDETFPGVLVVRPHPQACLLHPPNHVGQAARRQDPVARNLIGVAGSRVLGQVPHGATGGHLSGRWLPFTGEDPGESRLARTVAADEPDPVALGHTHAHIAQEELCPGPDFQAGCADHCRPA